MAVVAVHDTLTEMEEMTLVAILVITIMVTLVAQLDGTLRITAMEAEATVTTSSIRMEEAKPR